MTQKTEHMPEVLEAVWDTVIDYAERHQEAPITGKVMHIESGDWKLYLNGTKEPVSCNDLMLPPYHLVAFYRGWLWIFCTPQAGQMCGSDRPDSMTAMFVKAIREA